MKVLRTIVGSGVVAAAFIFGMSTATAQNLLVNGDFENASGFTANPITTATVNQGWATFGASQSDMSTSSDKPESGSYSLLAVNKPGNTWNPQGAYQIVNGTAGVTYTFSAYALIDAPLTEDSTWTTPVDIQIQFLDGSLNNLATSDLGWSATGPVNTWQQYSVSGTAPAGTVYIAVYLFFMENGTQTSTDKIYFDNVQIPGVGQATTTAQQWNIVWDDEFNQPDGSSPNPAKWTYDTGGGGYGNNELEYYTSRTNNARIEGGQLVIEADQETTYSGYNYTSARMLTEGKWSWTYGRMEARIKIPRGQGIWPAFWMLGTDIDAGVGWPTCGEIDIMENIGKVSDQGTDHGTIHGPQGGGDYNGGSGVGRTYTLPGGAALADDFHIYAVEWTTNQIKFYLDTNLFFTATPASLPSGGTWVFSQPQFLILNVAVGGNWPGNPDGTTVFPQQMLVDYVRVYQQTAPLQITATESNGSVVLSWPTNIVCHLQTQTNSLASGGWSDQTNTISPVVLTPNPNNASVYFRLASP